VVSAIQTMNDSSLWWVHGWKDRYKMLYDVISYNDVTSALSLNVFVRNMRFIGVILKSFSV